MQVYSENKNKLTGECSYIDDYKMAQKIASILKIKLIFLDFEKQYKESVLNPMFNSYSRNLTPNPDIACNKIIKFPLLWEEARKLKCDYIATGHYAQTHRRCLLFRIRPLRRCTGHRDDGSGDDRDLAGSGLCSCQRTCAISSQSRAFSLHLPRTNACRHALSLGSLGSKEDI